MKLIVRNATGTPTKQMEVDDSVFGIEPNMSVLHQAFVTGRNNQRAGTAQTKTRGMVQGSTKKVRRQKYTGRSRQGGNRAPHRVGGGVAFGPVQRSYAQALPKKMKRLAIRSALSGKAADGQLVVIDQLALGTPKTKQLLGILRAVGIQRSALVVTAQTDRAILASLRNLPKTKALPAAYLNVVDMLNHQSILMTEDAVRIAEQLWAVKTLEKAKAPAKAAANKAPPRKARAAAEVEAVAEALAVEAPAPKPIRASAKVSPKAKAEAPAPEAPAPKSKRPSAKAAPEAMAEVEAKLARVARRPKATAEVEAKPARAVRKPKEAAEVEAKPARAVRKPKPSAEAEAKPARTARKPKAPDSAASATKPAPRKRATKKTEGEG